MQNTSRKDGAGQVSAIPRDFNVWKTIKLGTGPKTADNFQRAIEESGCSISDWGSSILHDPTFAVSRKEVEYELVDVSNADLGFNEGATAGDTYARALELGLELCLIELGPRLCLDGEECCLAMEPVVDSACNGNVFLVKRDANGKLRLHGEYCNPDDFFPADKCFVFMRRKKASAL